MKRAIRVVVVASLASLALVGMTRIAQAHALLLSSNPAAGSTLQNAPTQLTLNYSEEPDPQLSEVELLNSSGSTVATGAPSLQGQKTLLVPITGDMPDGVYTVSWSAVSVDDGHTTTDSFSFGVGVTAPPPGQGTAAPATASGPTVLGVAGKALLYAGLMLVVAVAVIGEGVFGGAPKARPRIAAWAGPVAVVGSIALLISQQQATHASMGRFLGSQAARTPIALLVVCVVAAIFALVAWWRPQRWLPWAAGVTAAVAMAVRAHGGHATATSTPLLSQVEQWIHMIAGACWAGGLVLLILLIRERRDDPPITLARRYSTVALTAIGVVVVTGLLRSISELGGLGQLVHVWDSSYGRTLAIKVAVVLLVIALGAVNRYRSVERLATDASPLRRIASTEVVAAVGIVLLTATLTSYSPPTGAPRADQQPGQSDVVALTGSDVATTTTIALTVTPAQPGPNLYRATVTAFGTDTPASADALTLQLNSVTQPNLPGSSVTFKSDGGGGWVAQSLDPSTPGTFAMLAHVRSGDAVTEVPLTLVTRSAGTITTGIAPDQSTVANASFTDGVRLQGTSSAGSPTQIHLTAFAANGTELPLSGLQLAASPASGPPIHLTVQRFSAGHFAASPTLGAGTWTIDAVATSKDGQAYQVTWQATVTP
ncbi:MAG TPA: copper resistance protein CopC [Actinomycetota bacterium]|nr:copper resistance protein CopC [Actinomycetota bacterium]